MRPRSGSPQLLIWAQKAGSSKKRCLAAVALRSGLTPTALAKKLGYDAGWLGRWFRRNGNGEGGTLRLISEALRVSVVDPFATLERELLDLLRSTGKQYFTGAFAFADKVYRELRSCKSETREEILAQYALDRAVQERELTLSISKIADRDNWKEPTDAFDACIVAVTTLAKRRGFTLPVKPNSYRQPLVLSLFAYISVLRDFTTYITREPLFDAEQALTPMLERLRNDGNWPEDMLDDVASEVRKLIHLP
jgi:transcriptional regulator with XRE-family HTH domain